MLESLVADNEALKHDYAEVQNILSETREDLRALQEEVEERRVNVTEHYPPLVRLWRVVNDAYRQTEEHTTYRRQKPNQTFSGR